MTQLTCLTGKTYGPFVVTEDNRDTFHDHVTVRATCCGAVSTKAVTNLNTVLWRNSKRCNACRIIEAMTPFERAISNSARKHPRIKAWTGVEGTKRMAAHLGPRPPGHRLGVKDITKPHSPTNSAWMTDGEIRIARGTAVAARCADGSTGTQSAAAKQLGLSRQAIQQRQKNGWTLDEATTTPKGEMPERLIAVRRARA